MHATHEQTTRYTNSRSTPPQPRPGVDSFPEPPPGTKQPPTTVMYCVVELEDFAVVPGGGLRGLRGAATLIGGPGRGAPLGPPLRALSPSGYDNDTNCLTRTYFFVVVVVRCCVRGELSFDVGLLRP